MNRYLHSTTGRNGSILYLLVLLLFGLYILEHFVATAHASETSCFGLLSNDSIVCSARGTCIGTDQCACDTNYFGILCDVTTCFGTYSNDTSVCSGFGACVAHDSCSCNMGYTGSDCSQWFYGEAYSIGNNSVGQLGVDDTFNRTSWMRISAPLSYGDHVKFMQSGDDFAVAITRENKLFIWGKNSYYNLGTGSFTLPSVRPYRLLSTYNFTSACAGRYHGAAVTTTGKVFTWGTNTQDGRLTCTTGTGTCSETSCSCTYGSYAPTINGMLGLGSYYYSTIPREVSLGTETVVEIGCGLYHTVARTTTGKLYAWGHGGYGQLGVQDWSNRYTPTFVSISVGGREVYPTKIVMVATGQYHTVALSAQGAVFTWGDNSKGQLGYTDLSMSNKPTLVRSTILTLPIIQVAAGSNSSYALTSTGEVYAWGDNSQGQLGLGSTPSSVSIPTRVPGLEEVHVISLSCSANTVMVVARNGSAYSWGVNTNGQAADGSSTSKIYVPTLVVNPYPRKIVRAAPGNVFSLILFNTTYCFDFPMDDELACSARGQCIDTDNCLCNVNYFGDRCHITSCYGTGSNDSTVCSAIGHCIAHDTCQCPPGYTGEQCEKKIFGSLRSLGRNTDGQIGDDYTIQRSEMTKVYYPLGDGTLVSKIVAGDSISFAITTSGRLYGWGQGDYYRLGNQDQADVLIPTPILPDHKIVSVCSGIYHSVAVTSEGKLYSWGFNTRDGKINTVISGQLGVNITSFFSTPRLLDPIDGTPIEVACGDLHTLVLTKEGHVFGFGDDVTYGAVGNGLNQYEKVPVRIGANNPTKYSLYETKIISIAAGQYHSMALGAQGEIYTWGYNSNGQLGYQTTDLSSTLKSYKHPKRVRHLLFRESVIQISAGIRSSYAITNEGNVFSWGSNTNGQLGIGSTIDQNFPTPVPSLQNADTISARYYFALVATRNGSAWGFGSNSYGNLGDNTTKDRNVPSLVINPYESSSIVMAGPGYYHSLFLMNGTYCFNILSDDESACSSRGNCIAHDTCVCDVGYIGSDCSINICFGLNSSDPRVCSGQGTCVAHNSCVCELYFSGFQCEFPVYGLLYALGDNSNYDTGDELRYILEQTPFPVNGVKYVKHVVAAVDVSLALTTDGELYTWGKGVKWSGYGKTNVSVGLLGDDTVVDRDRPVRIMNNTLVKHVCAGKYHVAVLTENNKLYTWGINTASQTLLCKLGVYYAISSASCPCALSACPEILPVLGNSTYYWSNVPVEVTAPSDNFNGASLKEIACGTEHTLVRTSTGAVYGWGMNTNQQLGGTEYYTNKVHVPILLQSNAPRGELLGSAKVISIAAGEKHSMALTSNGSVFSWGSNTVGQIGIGSTNARTFHARPVRFSDNQRAVEIGTSLRTSFAITEDRTLSTWGENYVGLLGVNSTVTTSFFSSATLNPYLKNNTLVHVSVSPLIGAVQVLEERRSFGWGNNTNKNLGLNATGIVYYPQVSFPRGIMQRYIVSLSTGPSQALVVYNGTYCFDILSDDENVCSARGNCISHNLCICDEGYSGDECNNTSCFGLNITDANVCNGHGTCVALDTCSCELYHSGEQCEKDVFGLLYSVGSNSNGQLGDDYYDDRLIPEITSYPLTHGKFVKLVAAGQDVSFALTTDGELYSWGQGKTLSNSLSLLGDGTLVDRNRPVRIMNSFAPVTHVCVGALNVVVSTIDNRVYTWGLNTVDESMTCQSSPLLNTLCPCEPAASCPSKSGVLGNSTYYWTNTPIEVTRPSDNFMGESIVELACGTKHTILRTSSGRIYGWGVNTQNQLGDINYYGKYVLEPTLLQSDDNRRETLGDKRIISIAAGDAFSMVLTDRGRVYVWGDNSRGQAADSTTSSARTKNARLVRHFVRDRVSVYKISAGRQSAYAVTERNELFAWGDNLNGQLGINSTFSFVSTPFSLDIHNISFLHSNVWSDSVIVATSSGEFGWGGNQFGQLSLNAMKENVRYPKPMHRVPYQRRELVLGSVGLTHALLVYNGTYCYGMLSDDETACSGRGTCVDYNTCECFPEFYSFDCQETFCYGVSNFDRNVCSGNGACMPNNTCVCYPNFVGTNCNQTRLGYLFGSGNSSSGQLGHDSSTSSEHIVKVRALNRVPVQFVASGRSFSLILTADHQVYSVGLNLDGQLGIESTLSSSSPVLTAFSKRNLTVSNIAVGDSFVVVSTGSGSLWGWGNNQQGQLGLGYESLNPITSPHQISSFSSKVYYVSCGGSHCLSLTEEGHLYSWGGNSRGQLGDGTSDTWKSNYLPIRVLSIFAVKKPASLFAGAYHSLATTEDGVLYAWGDDSKCQLGQGISSNISTVPIKVKGFSSHIRIEQVTGGEDFSCALSTMRQVWCWGANDQGQLGINSTESRCSPTLLTQLLPYHIISIASGGSGSIFALTNNGTLIGWGNNLDGQLGLGTKNNVVLSPTIIGSEFTQRTAEQIAPGPTHSMILYHGTTCFNILQDDPDVCSGNGTCIDWDTCVCTLGFSGRSCEFTSCFGYNMTDVENVCTGRGECRYLNTCICDPDKWFGDRCQYISCFGVASNSSSVCSSHGNCTSPHICNCTHGYCGDKCEHTTCHGRNSADPLVCSGHGACVLPDNCLCQNGYTGGNCSYPICHSRYYDRITGITTIYQSPFSSYELVLSTEKDCSGRGVCISPKECNCSFGYVDEYCSTPVCFGLNVTNPASCNYGKNGTCVAPNNCTCLTQFDSDGHCVPLSCYGKNLTTNPPSCNSHLQQGNCIDIDRCACVRGYGGLECEQHVCFDILQFNSSVCSGRGSCTRPDWCQCELGYSGRQCEFIDCFGRLDVHPLVCSAHGTCVGPDLCECNKGFTGENCQYPICYGIISNETGVCFRHGKCVAPDTCECDHGYYGLECKDPSCFGINHTDSEVCSSHGVCNGPDKCNCTTGWVSRDCSIPTCFGIWGTNYSVCSKYGFCFEPDVCLCSPGRTGDNCQLNSCYGYNETDPMVCSGHGRCVGPQQCNCTANEWTGTDCQFPMCFGVASTDRLVCSKHGVCTDVNVCECEPDSTGANCESVNTCFGNNGTDATVCSGHGVCSMDRCNCSYGWTGQVCSSPVCFGIPFDHPDTCSGVGTCVSADTCDCNRTFGRTGVQCQLHMCFGINETDSTVCSSSGTCIGVDTCKCARGRTGAQCELNICYSRNESDPMVCHANGVCTSPDVCECLPTRGFVGNQCNVPVCYGETAEDPHFVCSGNGSCIAPNNCSCRNGRTGLECELNICFGRNSSDHSVCSGHGSCTKPNTCECLKEYTGDACQIPICFGVDATDNGVCHHFGDCVAPDTCHCKNGSSGVQCEVCPNGYHGDLCTVVECFGRLSNDSLVCSGHGQCIKPDECNCHAGYVDTKCHMPVCNNILANDTRVCSARGKCIARDKCRCDIRFYGNDCELLNLERRTSGELVLVSQVEQSSQRISLVDLHSGKEMFSFLTMVSSKTFYHRTSSAFYMVREDGIYTFNSTSASKLSAIPDRESQNLHDSTVLVSKNSLFIVSLVNEIRVCNMSLHSPVDISISGGNLPYQTYATTLYIPLEGNARDKFVTVDTSTNVLYVLARRKEDRTIVILRIDSGKFSEVMSFVSFPSVSEVQALMLVSNELYILKREYLSKVVRDQLALVTFVTENFFANGKFETDSHIYLKDTTEQTLMTFPKNQPIVDASFIVYPQDLTDKSFTIVGAWEPQIESLSPSGVPVDSLENTWISLRGINLNLEQQSWIALTDPSSKLSVTAQLVECSSGNVLDVCFKPSFAWPSGRDSVQFSEVIIYPANNSTPAPQPGLSLTYFHPRILSISPTTATSGDIITVNAPWFSTLHNISCSFVWRKPDGEHVIRQGVSVGIYPQKVLCPVPSMNGANNHVVEIYVTMSNRDFTPKSTPAFFYYLDTRLLTFYDSFDQDTIMEVFEPGFSSVDNTVIEWMEFDERFGRSTVKMTSYLSPLKPRSMLLSKSALINRVDQQLQLEFVSDLGSAGNVELWYMSERDQSYNVYASVSLDSDGTYSLSISYQLGESMTEQMTKVITCPDYALGTVHTLEMKLVRPEIEMMNHNITLFNEWISTQNISTNSSNPVPDEPWRIDAVLKKGYSAVCSLSFGTDKSEVELFKQMFLSEGLLAISQSLPLHVQTPSSPVLNIDRVWISCQYEATYGCNVTHVPKNIVNTTTTTTSDAIANLVQQQGKAVVAVVSSVAGSFFLLFLLLAFVPGILFVVWKLFGMRSKREKQAKLDAWKFEFALNRNVSSLDDKRFSVSRRVYQTSQDENKLKGALRRFAQVRDYEMQDVSTGSDSEMESLDDNSA